MIWNVLYAQSDFVLSETFYEKNPGTVIALGVVAGLILLGTVVFVVVKIHIYHKQTAQTSAETANKETSEVPMTHINNANIYIF